jgi:molecular chaperone DnaK (HSP70)
LPVLDDEERLSGIEADDVPTHAIQSGDSAELLADSDDVPDLLDEDAREATGAGTAVDMQVDEDPNEMTQVLSAIKTTNVNAHSLGVALKREDGVAVNSIVIPRNTPLPASVTRRYGTNVLNQTAVSVHVVEGESKLAEECIHVGTCRITNLPWGLRKGSTIYVTFSYDNSGRIEVKAVEATSGKSATTTLQRDGAMDAQQVDKVRQAVERITVS